MEMSIDRELTNQPDGAPQPAISPFRGMRLAVFSRRCDLPKPIRSIQDDPDFAMIRHGATRSELLNILEDFVPEIVVAGDEEIHELTEIAMMDQYSFFVVHVTRAERSPAHECARIAATVRVSDDIEAVRAATYKAKSAAMSATLQDLARFASEYRKFGPFQRYAPFLETLDSTGTAVQIPVSAIVSILADGKYVIVNSALGEFRMRESLENLQLQLDPRMFQRVHRGSIVNRLAIVQMLMTPEGPRLQLSDGTVLPVGPRYRNNIASVAAMELLA